MEVIVSSVKPFQLMMGKIIGVAMVGLTQFLLWVVLTFVIITAVTSSLSLKEVTRATTMEAVQSTGQPSEPGIGKAGIEGMAKEDSVSEIFAAINSINFPVMIGSFLFFFLFGYLMYAALFAAIGGAVDSEADTQQFILPLTVPLILAIVLSQFIIQEPEGPMAFWLSIVPLTSPVVMMIRIPFGVPYLQVLLSMVLLLLGFLGTTWMAGKIYRTGILMYGKKLSYREIWRWVRE